MAVNPKFYLKNPKTEGESLIFMGIKINTNELFKYSTSCKIIPELFDKHTKRPTTDKKLIAEYAKLDTNIKAKLSHITKELNNLEESASEIMKEQIRFKGEVKSSDLKIQLDEIYNSYRIPVEKKNSITFNKYLMDFIKKIESGEKLHGNVRYTKGTIKTYKTFQNIIDDYKPNIDFDKIDIDFYNDFVQHLNKKEYSLNSVGKNIKFIKVIMKDALENGYHSNMAFTFKEFRNVNENIESVYLTELELDALYNLDLKGKPNYETARDVFLIGCYTALRYSDYSRIGKLNVKTKEGYNQLEIITQKTNTLVKIPIKPRVMDILTKYNFLLPRTHEQKVNLYLKEICKIAGITEKMESKSTIGGKVVISHRPKNELVKTHTARRTGATLLYLAEVPPIDIMKITGHSKESNLLKYISITKEQTAERLAKNPFFK